MHDDRELVEARLDRFLRDHLRPALYRDARPLQATAWQVPREPVPFAEASTQVFTPVPLGWKWGRAWSTVWLRITGELPREWIDSPQPGTRAEILIDFGYNRSRSGFQAEGLAYRPDGTLIKSIAPMNSYLPWSAADGPIDVFVEAAANPDVAGDYDFDPTPYGEWDTAPDEPLYELKQLEVALIDETVWELLQDVWTLRGLMLELPVTSSRRHELLRALESMLDVLDPDDIPGTAQAARDALADVAARPAHASAHRVVATGHAHIDSAWLWPLRETVRKCARTFTNVMALMDEHPDFVFACSSAQQYQWMKEYHPQVFERIREKVAAGQFVPVGGMWVESDTNMPGSEAMARQFIAGKRFFLEEFGVDCEEAWLPDSFGYSGALPQIVAAAGERWFLTQKISWNQTNKMPHHTFRWEGIDGTRVFTHFPPVDSYNCEISAAELAHAEANFSEKGRATVSLAPFGWGDGGGGPTREMIAAAHRTADLEGSPAVRIGTPRSFFEEAEAEYPDAPVWNGEMYLELHRGVFTSQLRTKQGNRRNEALLREAELWAATASVRTGFAYPQDELDRAWQTVLLLQFHDILPGSAIAWVHREAERRHAEVSAVLERIIAEALSALAGDGDDELVVNASPFARGGVPPLAAAPSASAAPLGEDDAPPPTESQLAGGVSSSRSTIGDVLDNGIVRAVIDDHGHLVSLVAHADGREAIPAGEPANVLRLHRDLPNLWDAWDLDAHYRRTVTELTEVAERRIEHADDGSVAVVTVRVLGAEREQPSTITQRLVLRPGADAIEIENLVDWHEREKILKLAVPLDVHADRIAAETQFGHIFRSTHVNTSWDAARFEACQHRFVHIAEPGYGVAIANDSTYGYDTGRHTRADGGTTTTVRFSLLRAPLFPDPESDQGEHMMRFRIRPGAAIGDAVALGFDLQNAPRRIWGTAFAPLVTSSDPAVVVQTVKLAEDGSGDVVVRLYESRGGRARTRIRLDAAARSVELTDLLERPLPEQEGIAGSTAEVELPFRPFQLRTLRFRMPR
ncbi:glycoside hydrolase family 38 C-terminal domain-containing protein [Homoserinibacter sp. GY 40078]|uniref:alpha-mannosidase n=1 Tax=Homoserinibacter sp. GY 40078 TaxID=2603275 RepID=UPI0011CC2C4D|nr:glycoside hydrolase family 38 C-terminal domain-containing protein [Homoserinibacter sp. GY 40078]TXK18769.1 alpha-mannosidase [Homoserinibacter sp. GY 40078]